MAHQQTLCREGARGRFVQNLAQRSAGLIFALMLLAAGMQAAHASPNFSNLSLTPSSGAVDAGKTLPVAFDYDVAWTNAGDCGFAVKRVEVIDNGKAIEPDQGYKVVGCPNGDPDAFDELRSGPITVNLGIGTHVLMLRAYANKPELSGYSEQRTIIITSKDDAQRVGESVPAEMVAGQQYDVSVTLKNTGVNTWATATHKLGAQPDDMTWGLNRVTLNASVAPGATKTINFKVTAPATPGSYPFQWRMLRDSTWFGEASTKVMVNVIPPKPTLKVTRDPNPMLAGEPFQLTWVSTNATKVEYECTSSNGGYVGKGEKSKVSDTETLVADPNWVDRPSECKWTATGPNGTDTVTETMTTIDVTFESAFVDQRVPSSVNAGRNYAASVTMKNTGTGTWRAGSNFQLGSQNPADNQTWGLSRVDVDADVKPGDSKTFTFSIKAPTTLGNADFQWQMVRKKVDGSSIWFGAKSTNKSIKVLAEDAPIPVDITPPHLSNPDAGTLPGELSVNNAGAATYSIPIEVPPGTAGLKPNLSISYSSQAGNGPLGLGWSLGGLSSIHRCGKTIAQDGVNGRIRFDIGDRLCLDGQRLVLVNKPLTDENYWSDKAEFRTEIDQMSRITAYGAGKLARFKVETRDKRTLWYGGNAAGANTSSNVKAIVTAMNVGTLNEIQPYDKAGALSWAVDRITDRAGNYISFTYEQDSTTGEHKPLTIRYGGVGLKSHAAVQFTWEARPDAWKRYVDDARNDLRSRISHIKTYYGNDLNGDVTVGGTLVRDYAFSYEQSPTSGRSMLTSAQVCALNPQSAQPECLPATTFEWGKPAKAAGWQSRGAFAGAPNMTTSRRFGEITKTKVHDEYFAFADFENHGFTDVLEKRVSSPWPAVNLPGDQEFREDANPLGFDVYRNQYRYFHNDNGAGFTLYNYQISTGQDFVVLATADFNGDGAPDLLVHVDKVGAKICLSPLSKKGPQGAPGSMITFDCHNGLAAIGDNSQFGAPYALDVLGDGRSALYSRVDVASRHATLCVQGSCSIDSRPPLNYLGFAFDEHGSPPLPLNTRIRFNDMVDFAGTGKQQAARWTYPHFLQRWTDVDGTHYGNRWENKQPVVSMTGFRQPGTPDEAYAAGSMVPYLYNPYNPRVCGIKSCVGVVPPYDFNAGDTAGNHEGGSADGDFNGTGYSGLTFGFIEFDYDADYIQRGYSRAELTHCLSTGRRLDCGIRKKYSGAAYVAPISVGNYVGDGTPTFRGKPTQLIDGIPKYGDPQMCRVLGDDTTGGTGTDDANIVCVPWSGLPEVTTSYEMDLLGTGRTQVVNYFNGEWQVYEPIDVAAEGQALDRIHQVINGVGAKSWVEYADGVAGGYVTRTGDSTLSYPQHPTAGVGKIARRLTHSIGSTAERSFSYTYEDAGIDVAGRGSLGFAKVIQKDEQKYTTTTTTYSQQWPFVGMVLSQVTESGYKKPRTETTNRLLQKTVTQSNQQKTYCPLSAGSKVARYDFNDQSLGTVTTAGVDTEDIQYDNRCNLLKSKVVAEGSAVDESATFTTKTVNTYYAADFDHWLVDLLESTKVTKEQSGDERKVTRDRSFWYEPNFSGRVSTEVIQGLDPDLAFTTEYKRDGNPFGLVNDKIEYWFDPLDGGRRERTSKTTYDAKGRLPVTVTNAEKHTETRAYNFGSGALISHIDVNQLETKWTVDGFGRVLTELRPDGNETRSYVKQCVNDWSDCPHYAVVARVTDYFHGSDRMAVPQVTYQDEVGHVLQTKTWGFDGREILVEQTYDGIGRLYKTYHPRYKGDPSYIASYQYYDVLDRVWYVGTYGEDSSPQSLTTDYQGMVTVITNPKRQKRTEKRNALGQVRLVIDNKNGETRFGYDAWGNLNQTIDPNGNVINVLFDDLGRRKKLDDPDLGVITYTPDAAGRVRKQITPNDRALNKSTTMDYDMLDRMTERRERSLESHWVYDLAPTKGIGRLNEAYTVDGNGVKDYRRIHTYDELGRPSKTTQVLADGNYTATPGYDTWGRQSKQTYKRGSDGAKEFFLRYNEYGYQSSVERPGTVLAQVLKQDAANRITLTQLGNGLTDTTTYYRYTGRMETGMVKTGANGVRLQEGYTYDELGNVLVRNQQWDTSGFVEEFHYDELNRLWTSTVDGKPQKTFDYDAAGNITNKTGLNWYTYPAQGAGSVRPHAVKSITNIAGQFDYDDNGNLLSGAGRTISWTSFDMPLKITKGTSSSTFAYGSEHQRLKQTKGNGAVTIYAGAQEVEKKDGVITVKTYWPNGIGLEIDKPNSDFGTQLLWTHTDRLGSPVAITDSSGQFAEKLEYDAWGKRRSTGNHDATPDSLDGVVDNKGFTNHEMLDQLDLVHMNGRVYDPLTARFLSGDPIIQDPTDGQNYNRYSYVVNNPTNLTDPTGFCADGDSGVGTRICGAVNPQAFGNGFNGYAAQNDMRAEADARKSAAEKKDASGNNQSNAKEGTTGTAGKGASRTASGRDPSSLQSALLDTGKAGWNAGIGFVESAFNLIGGGALPFEPYPSYVPFMSEYRATYDTPSFGLTMEVLSGVGALRVTGELKLASQPKAGVPQQLSAEERANQLHAVLDPRAQRHRTTAVTETAEGVRVVSSSTPRLAPAQRKLLLRNEVEGTGPGHAEVTGINAARKMGLTPTGTAASRPICYGCANTLTVEDVKALSKLKL